MPMRTASNPREICVSETDHGGEPQWADQYRGLSEQFADAREVVDATEPAQLIDMTQEHVDALEARARLADELYQVAKKFLREDDSPAPVAP
jgi:hypothetical protein